MEFWITLGIFIKWQILYVGKGQWLLVSGEICLAHVHYLGDYVGLRD